MSQEHVVYKLQGKSLAAAKELEKLAEAHWKAQPPVVYPINMLDAQRRSQEIYAGFMRKLHDENPALEAATGLDKPVTKVLSGIESSPRAYVAWPEIFTTAVGPKPEYFMYVPIGHDGSHFEPEDGVKLNAQQEQRAGNALWAGGWMDNAPLATRPDIGVPLPAGFDPATSKTLQRNGLSDETQTVRVFRAAGASLAAVQSLQNQETAHSEAVTRLFDHIKSMAPTTAQLYKPDGSPGPVVNVYANMSLSDDGESTPRPTISIRIEGSGEPLGVKDSEGYIVAAPAHGGDVYIVPNVNTEAGKLFAELLNHPDLRRKDVRNYPQLRYPAVADGVNGQFQEAAKDYSGLPIMRDFGGDHYLVYRVERDKDDPRLPGPPDAIPVSPAAFHWLDADATDGMRGISPPPMPPEIAAELGKAGPQPGLGKKAPEAHP
jgi:hypothetical protein